MTDEDRLKVMAEDIHAIKLQMAQVILAIRDAESEIPEKMRRFMNYMHDVHDVRYMYEETGVPVPEYINREIERLHDRYRQLLHELHLDDGAFGKIKREMAEDPLNRYDHTKLLPKN